MLTITYAPNNGRIGSAITCEWHIGLPKPMMRGIDHTSNEVLHIVEVQADGHELDHILAHTNDIPRAVLRLVQCWFGDDAKFIVANIL